MIAIRLPQEVIAGLKISARQHGMTVSDLLRALISEQLARDGISIAEKPIEGQMSM